VRLLKACVVTFVVLFIAGSARAAEGLERAILDLSVNGSARGEVFVFIGGGDVLVPLAALRDAGLERLEVPTLILAGAAHVSLKAASPPLPSASATTR
jgi:hypothetical protein